MPAISKADAAERVAKGVEAAEPSDLPEIYSELFPARSSQHPLAVGDITRHLREGLEAEEIVDLWNVVFPRDRNVWYGEEARAIRFNEGPVGFAE